MATIHQFDNNPEEDEFYLVEIYWFITYTLVEPSINQQFIYNIYSVPSEPERAPKGRRPVGASNL